MIRSGFLLIGWTTLLAPPIVSRGFTSRALFETYPTVITPFVLMLLMGWGAAMLSVATRYRECRALIAVFAAGKLLFFSVWVIWWLGGGARLGDLFAKDPLAGLFFASFGLLDLSCAIFFAAVAFAPSAPLGSEVHDG